MLSSGGSSWASGKRSTNTVSIAVVSAAILA
jgi:hypothetical protein